MGVESIKEKVKQLKQSKDGKVLVKNFAYLSLLQIIGYVFPLITIPYLARVIGVDGYGKIAFALSVIVYFQTFVDWGFSYTAVRDIAKNKENREIVSKIFSNVLFSKILLFGFATVIFAILVTFIPFLNENQEILWFTFLIIPGYILFPDWLFQAMEEMKYITLMNFFSKLIFTILIFVAIKEKSDYVIEPLLNACGMIVCGVTATIYALKKFGLKLSLPSLSECLLTIKSSTNMFISLFLPNLYTNFSVTLLGFVGGSVATGIYSSGKKFIDITDQFSNVLSRTFFPFLARRLDKHSLYVKISGTISVLMGLFLFLSADLLVDIFYTEEFSNAANIIRIMAIAPFFCFLMNTYGTNYLVLSGREDVLRNIILGCSVFGFVVSWFATVYLNYIGVAVTITLIWGIRGVLTYLFARKIKS